jgi:Putative zinc-finger
MTTHLTDDQLQDVLDGVLDGAERAAFGAHFAACPECTARLVRLRAMVAETRALPKSIDPPRDLFPAVRSRIGEARMLRLSRRRQRWRSLAAAVLLIAASSAVTMLMLHGRAPRMSAAVLPPAVSVMEANYVQAVDDLQHELDAAHGLSPATVAVVKRNLAIIDQAIRESRAALAHDPANGNLARILWTTYQQKLDLLQRATRLASS